MDARAAKVGMSHIRAFSFWLALILVTPLPADAFAQVERTYSIPAQPLASGLLAYGRQSGVQVLYDSRLAVGRRSSPVRGRMPSSIALGRLLEGTGLAARYVDSGAVTLVLETESRRGEETARLGTLVVSAPPPRIGGRGRDLAYVEMLQTMILADLRREPMLSTKPWRVIVRMQVSQAPAIGDIELDITTGDLAIDRRIVEIIENVSIDRAPSAGMVQPIRFEFRSQ